MQLTRIQKLHNELPGAVVLVGDGKSKMADCEKWRKVWDEQSGRLDDQKRVMVAGIKMICQSIDLVQGHVFEGLEPHPINAEAIQYGFRGYRIGQEALEVVVNWLCHQGSYVEEMILNKNLRREAFDKAVRARTRVRGSKEASRRMPANVMTRTR
jgi:hypothetical protein